MKIAVTGGRGVLGINLLTKLVSLGHDVISLDRKYKPNTCIDGVVYITHDIQKISELKMDNVDFIYHLAAVGVDKISSFENPDDVFRNIVIGTNSVIEFSKRHDCKLIYSGSASRFFNVNQSPYTLYKSFAEDLIKLHQIHFNLKADIATIYNVYGKCRRTKEEVSGLLKAWNIRLQSSSTVDIYGDGDQVKDFIHIDDVIDGLTLLLDNNQGAANWHLGSNQSHSVMDVFNFYKSNHPSISYKKIQSEKTDNADNELLNSDFSKEYNWHPKNTLENYVRNL